MIVLRYGAGGFDPHAPNGNAVEWVDEAARTRTVVTSGGPTTVPLTDVENAYLDALARPGHTLEAQAALVTQIGATLASIQTRLTALAAWQPSATYTPADLATVRDATVQLGNQLVRLGRVVSGSLS